MWQCEVYYSKDKLHCACGEMYANALSLLLQQPWNPVHVHARLHRGMPNETRICLYSAVLVGSVRISILRARQLCAHSPVYDESRRSLSHTRRLPYVAENSVDIVSHLSCSI